MNETRPIMRYAKRLLLTLMFAVLLLILAVLFIPSISRYAIQQASSHFLGHRLDIHTYHFNPTRLYLDGTFDDGSSIRINARHLLGENRFVNADVNVSIALLSHLLETDLPPIGVRARISMADQHIALNASMLSGKLQADMDIGTRTFHYTIEKISLPHLLNDLQLPRYVSGELSATGSGVGKAPLDVSLRLKSYNIKLEEPLLTLAGLTELLPSVDLTLSADADLSDSHALAATIHIDSDPFAFTCEDANYDLESGAYSLLALFTNRGISDIPIHKGTLFGFGRYDDKVTGHYVIDADAYRIKLTHVTLAPVPFTLQSDFIVISEDTSSFDISGPNALTGSVAYADNRLSASVGTGTMPEPIRIDFNHGLLTLISNNIPIKTLAAILNHPDAADGHMRLDAAINTDSPLPGLKIALDTDDLMLTSPLFREYNLTAPVQLALKASNHASEYQAELELFSDSIGKGTLLLGLDAQSKKGTIRGKIHDFTLPWYRTPELNLTAAFDLDRRVATSVTLMSTFDRFHIPKLHYGDHLDTAFEYSISALNRFIPDSNASSVLEGNGSIVQTATVYDVSVETKGIGTVYATLDDNSQTLSADKIQIEKLLQTLGQPALLHGEMTLVGQLDAEHGLLTLSAPLLTPAKTLKETLRPFPLEVTLGLSRCNQRYFGNITAKTAYDTLTLSSIDIDLFRQSFGADYLLRIIDVNQSLIRLPSAYLGKQLALKGDFVLTPAQQKISCHTKAMLLPEQLHSALDSNATGPLPLSLELNASNTYDEAHLTARLASKALTLSPLKVRYDRQASMAYLESLVTTTAYPDPISVDFHAVADANGSMHNGQMHLNTRLLDLNMTRMYADSARQDYRTEFTLSASPSKQMPTAGKAVISGAVRTQPELQANLNSASFDGNLSVSVNDTLFVMQAAELNVSKITRYLPSSPEVSRGVLNAEAIICMPALLENNLSRLSGGIDVRLHNAYIDGIEFDSYLNTLRETQDLSLFQGSVSDLPIIRSVKDLPSDLANRRNIATTISNARAAVALSNGMAVCEDCALATDTNRIALAGDVNLTSLQFRQFYFALLNPEGCPYFMQRIKGPLLSPEINLAASGVKVIGGAVVSLASNVTDAANWLTGTIYRLTSATGDVISYVPIAGTLTDKTLTTVTGTLHTTTQTVSGCTPFYVGSVPPPRREDR